jgi:DNA invertase Pin-like site-specific DNA recombinase
MNTAVNTPTTKFVIYKRLSKQKQQGNQYGFEAQDHDIAIFLKQYPDAVIISEITETFTGKTLWTQRKGLVKAVELCEQTGATLLVSKIDRLGRHVESVSHLLNRINVKIATMPSATNMVIQIMSVMAEEEARAISMRTKAALQAAKARGVKLGGAANVGKTHKVSSKTKLDNQKKYVTQTQPKYEYLRQSLTNMRNNNYTYQQCADNLNLMGTLTPNNSKWCPVKVSRALIYLGVS